MAGRFRTAAGRQGRCGQASRRSRSLRIRGGCMSARDARQTILVTGVNGQVGFELARTLQGLGRVVAVDRSVLDLSNLGQVRTIVRDVRPSLIVNPAAYTAVDKAETELELSMRINGDAPGVLAEEAKKIGAALIHYSTDYVFDGDK